MQNQGPATGENMMKVEDTQGDLMEFARKIDNLIQETKERQQRKPTRECALTLTKLQEAMHWVVAEANGVT